MKRTTYLEFYKKRNKRYVKHLYKMNKFEHLKLTHNWQESRMLTGERVDY